MTTQPRQPFSHFTKDLDYMVPHPLVKLINDAGLKHISSEDALQLARLLEANVKLTEVTDEMVNRFLGWALPKSFSPDCGISFDGRKDDEWNKNKTWPIGTNLFNAIEARTMLEHVLDVKEEDTKPSLPPLTEDRKRFEQAYMAAVYSSGKLDRVGDEYTDPTVQVAWTMWKVHTDLNNKANAQTAVGAILSEAQMPSGYDRKMGNVIWWNKPAGPALVYTKPIPEPSKEPNLPGLADDPSAFVRWAQPKGYDMTCHPLHFLFLNEKTYAARDGWNACKHHYGITE